MMYDFGDDSNRKVVQLANIVYNFCGWTKQLWVDPDKYGYLDIVSDVYGSVLTHIPDGVTVRFVIKCVLPDGGDEIEIRSDDAVMRMFAKFGEAEKIILMVYNVQVCDHPTTVYTINGFPNSIVGRESQSGIDDSEEKEDSSSGGESFGFDDSSNEDWKGECGGMGNENSAESDEDRDGNGDGDGDRNEDGDGDEDGEDDLSDYNEDEYLESFSRKEYIDEDNKVMLETGFVYGDVNEFRAALQDFVIQEGFDILRIKNEKSRVTAICAFDGCTWRIHASPAHDRITYMIKSYNPVHKCERVSKNRNATSTWIAKKLAVELRADPDMKSNSMYALLNERYGIDPHPMQLYRARMIANEENEGSHAKAFAQLPSYGLLVRERNPGSVFKLQYQERQDMRVNPVFRRLFVCLDACKKGFLKGCRPFIGLDGCHLNGMYGGVLLSAIALDGNNGLFPLAFGVVEAECKDSWLFFLYNLYVTLHSASDDWPITFMSDNQKNLSEAIAESFPESHHRYCNRHLYNNFKAKFPGLLLRAHFRNALKAPNAFQFHKAMDAMKALNVEAHDWLMKIPVSMWSSHAFDHRAKSELVTNNMTESFNQWIAPLRSKPILTLIDQIRVKLMGRLHRRYEKGCGYRGRITPRMKKKLDSVQLDSRFCRVVLVGSDEFEVTDGYTRFVVNLRHGSCGCNVWDVTGMPCKHAAAVIKFNRGNVEDYCDAYFTAEKYLLAYGETIHPLPDLSTVIDEGENVVLQPPPLKRVRGRPCKNRSKLGEAAPSNFRRRASSDRCDICKEVGHNERDCRRAPVKGKGKRKKQIERQDETVPSHMQNRSQSSAATPHGSALATARNRARMAAMLAKK